MKTHHELALTEREHASMIQVRDLFASGAIEHSPTNVELPSGSVFYMGSPCFRCDLGEPSSGALMCIGGWFKAYDLGIVDADDTYETLVTEAASDVICDFVSEAEGELCELFNPAIGWAAVTPAVAALAIDGFLKTGKVNWPSVVGAGSI
ncbi:MAG: hypothetical protein KME20_26850 [Kaiparowitsia implicata GSE-PSE-MK54-09C]|jgi:hypothetical protein|nr:hypothetical protein [Kaiparowitsia implicata GSE-PSE-MK54-09C]